jgi:hypothetical protein
LQVGRVAVFFQDTADHDSDLGSLLACTADIATGDGHGEPAEVAGTTAVEPPVTASAPSAAIELPPFEPTGTYTPGEATPVTTASGEGKPRGQFRSWVADTSRGYSRMTDEQHHRIVVQFDAKPPADVLTALKGAGFQFQPEYHGQKNCWVRRNDFEGRLQIEAIETLIRETIRGTSSRSL